MPYQSYIYRLIVAKIYDRFYKYYIRSKPSLSSYYVWKYQNGRYQNQNTSIIAQIYLDSVSFCENL